jgi:acyl-coenzyme A synthetase/AMP-(fatty) acid ligase
MRSEELLVYCRNQLNDSMVPEAIDIWNDLPRDASGQIQKENIVSSYYWIGLSPSPL